MLLAYSSALKLKAMRFSETSTELHGVSTQNNVPLWENSGWVHHQLRDV
jgi:hypothetical protein